MSKKILIKDHYLLPSKEDNIRKGMIRKSEVDEIAASMGPAGCPYAETDLLALADIRKRTGDAYVIKVTKEKMAVLYKDEEVACVPLPHMALTPSDVRNYFAEAVAMAVQHGKSVICAEETSENIEFAEKDLMGETSFKNESVEGQESPIDIPACDKISEQMAAEAEDAHKSITITEEDMLQKSSAKLVNQGYAEPLYKSSLKHDKLAAMKFKQVVSGRNPMTPKIHLHTYSPAGNHIAELSSGRDTDGKSIYGVTTLRAVEDGDTHKWARDRENSKMFYSREEAEDHIKNLGQKKE